MDSELKHEETTTDTQPAATDTTPGTTFVGVRLEEGWGHTLNANTSHASPEGSAGTSHFPSVLTLNDDRVIKLGNKPLGVGGQGTVMKGLLMDGTSVAVKSLPPGDNTELCMLSKLSHSNIVRYIGYARTTQARFLAMEYVAGGSLRSLLNEFGVLHASQVAVYIRSALRGLQYLHTQRVAHCDLKPDNMLLEPNTTEVKLADFGIATLLSALVRTLHPTASAGTVGSLSRGSSDATTVHMGMTTIQGWRYARGFTGEMDTQHNGAPDVDVGATFVTLADDDNALAGTPAYMPPECIADTIVGPAGDIWSLGVTTLELLTGQRLQAVSGNPWAFLMSLSQLTDEGIAGHMERVVTGHDVPSDARQFVYACLRREPTARASAAQLLEHPFLSL